MAEVGTGFQDQTAIGVANGGNRAYIGTFDENAVKVFNTNTRKVWTRSRSATGRPGSPGPTPRKGQFAYVGLLKAKKVAVINTAHPRGRQADPDPAGRADGRRDAEQQARSGPAAATPGGSG